MNIFNRDYSFKKNHKLSHLEFYPLLFYVHLIKNITWLKHHRINHQLSFFYIFLEMYLLNLLNTHTHTQMILTPFLSLVITLPLTGSLPLLSSLLTSPLSGVVN